MANQIMMKVTRNEGIDDVAACLFYFRSGLSFEYRAIQSERRALLPTSDTVGFDMK